MGERSARARRRRRRGWTWDLTQPTVQALGRWMSWAALAAVVLALGGRGLAGSLRAAEPFRVDQLVFAGDQEVAADDPRGFVGLTGRPNIFMVDLRALSRQAERRHPEVRAVRVSRRLPNQLVVDVTKRVPCLQVHQAVLAPGRGGLQDRYLPVDRSGIVLPGARESPDDTLPVIEGLDFPEQSLKVGDRLVSEGIETSLALLDAVKRTEGLTKQRVARVDVASGSNPSFDLAKGVQVKLGRGRWDEKLALLATMLPELERENLHVDYIDLRFGDPIIGPR